MNLGEIIAVILAFNQDATTFYANLPQTQKGRNGPFSNTHLWALLPQNRLSRTVPFFQLAFVGIFDDISLHLRHSRRQEIVSIVHSSLTTAKNCSCS